MSPSLPKNGENLDAEKAEAWDDCRHVSIRMEAFDDVWSKIKSTIKVCPFDPFLSWCCNFCSSVFSAPFGC